MITVSLLEAEDKTDSGAIWKKIMVRIAKDMLYDEINEVLFETEYDLMSYAVEEFYRIEPDPQDSSISESYWARRTPKDSEVNPSDTLLSQFNLMRVCDPERFPAYFKLHAHRYKIISERMDDQ